MKPDRTSPLRKIIGERINIYGARVEILECGHEKNQKQDIYGYTNAYKRRCKKCARSAEPAPKEE